MKRGSFMVVSSAHHRSQSRTERTGPADSEDNLPPACHNCLEATRPRVWPSPGSKSSVGREPERQEDSPSSVGPYWARTSDPQLVESVERSPSVATDPRSVEKRDVPALGGR